MRQSTRSQHFSILTLSLALVGALLALPLGFARPANAAITLISFTAKPQGNTAILVEWETGTEAYTAGFNLRRALSAAELGTTEPTTAPLVFIQNKGDATFGDFYSYTDTAVTPGAVYYYRLYEVSLSGGSGDMSEIIYAGIGVATPTATATATVTATQQPTSTATPTRTRTVTPTNVPGELVQPTATRRFTNTPIPVVAPSGTPTVPGLPATPTATGLPSAVIAAPTSGGGQAVMPPVSATATPALTTPMAKPAVVAAAASPAPAAATDQVGVRPTATPRVFEPILGSPDAGRPAPAPEPAARSTGPLLAIGGAAVVLAALIGGAAIWWRGRRQG